MLSPLVFLIGNIWLNFTSAEHAAELCIIFRVISVQNPCEFSGFLSQSHDVHHSLIASLYLLLNL